MLRSFNKVLPYLVQGTYRGLVLGALSTKPGVACNALSKDTGHAEAAVKAWQAAPNDPDTMQAFFTDACSRRVAELTGLQIETGAAPSASASTAMEARHFCCLLALSLVLSGRAR
eukprot:11225039-Alexandrium_andersonii.AAC.1